MVDRGNPRSGPQGPGEDRHERTPRAGRSRPAATEAQVAELLSSLVPLTAPDAAARQRMRERVLAGAASARPASAAESRAAAPRRQLVGPPVQSRAGRAPVSRRPATATGSTRPGEQPARTMSGARGRFFVAGIAVLALVFSLAGMSLLLARDALPGDALYGIKRASEAASLGLTFSDESKAIKHLDFAASRVNEIETLAQRYPDPSDAPLGGYLSALSDLDADAAAGSRQMIALATGNDGRLLESLRDWSSQQASRLTAVVPHLPQAARSREDVSLALLNKIAGRSQALLDRMQCFEITSGSVDDIGALPATGVCQKPADGSAPGPTGGTRPDSVTAVTDPTSPPRVTGTAPTGATVPPGPGTGAAAGGGQTAQTGSQTGTQTVPPGGTTTPPAGGAPPLVIPLPLLPPITVPSLLPGLPPIQLGG